MSLAYCFPQVTFQKITRIKEFKNMYNFFDMLVRVTFEKITRIGTKIELKSSWVKI